MDQTTESQIIPEDWRCPTVRQHIRNRIDEAIKESKTPMTATADDLENQLFNKSKSREEYFSNTARIVHRLQKRQDNQQTGMIGQTIQQNNPDPISALHNLASFPSADGQHQGPKTQVPTNIQDGSLMNTVTSTPVSIHMTNVGNVGNAISSTSIQQMQQSPGQIHQMNSGTIQLQQMSSGNAPVQQLISVSGAQIQQIPAMAGNRPQMVQQRMGVQQNRIMMNTMMMQQNNAQIQGAHQIQRAQTVPRMRQSATNMSIQLQHQSNSDATFYQSQVVQRPQNTFQGPINSQFQCNQNIMIPSQSPQGMTNIPAAQVNQTPMSMSPSSSSFAPSPSQGLMPSPMSVGMINQRAPGSVQSVTSSSPLNTPVMISATSPAQRLPADEQAYLDKLKQLSRFIEPLKLTIARLDRDEEKKKDSKIRNLLSVISEPNKRVPMDILLKCEQVLEKMDFSAFGIVPSETSQPQPQVNTVQKTQEHNIGQPLIDAIIGNLKKPFFNHTLHRTFAPAVAALTNATYRPPSPPPKKRLTSDTSEIPEVVQSEIARLDQRFKVQLDPLQHSGSRTIHLICRLDDRELPCVPPISLRVPEAYPSKPPQCFADEDEYNASPILSEIKRFFDANIAKLPNLYSITTLLNRWEMSVRQACNQPHLLVA